VYALTEVQQALAAGQEIAILPQKVRATLKKNYRPGRKGQTPRPAWLRPHIIRLPGRCLTSDARQRMFFLRAGRWERLGDLLQALGIPRTHGAWPTLHEYGEMNTVVHGIVAEGWHNICAQHIIHELCTAHDGRMPNPIRVATACSGAGLGLVAIDELFGSDGWQYMFASEYCPAARALHEAIWGGRGATMHNSADAAPASVAPYTDMFLASPRCQPYSLECPRRDELLPYALEEFGRIMYYVYLRRPLFVVIETVAALLKPYNAVALARWTATLRACKGYEWKGYRICPSDMCGDCLRTRKRLYITGRRVDEI